MCASNQIKKYWVNSERKNGDRVGYCCIITVSRCHFAIIVSLVNFTVLGR